MKTKSKISGYILSSSAAALLLLCGVVALSSAINPKFPTSQNNIAFGVNGHESLPSGGATSMHTPMGGCLPNDYTITTGSGIIVPGITDTGNHCDDCVTPIALPFPVTFYDQTFFSVGVSSNGNLQFTGANESDFANFCPPTATVIDLIAPYWQDLHDEDTANGQGVFTSVSGTAPNRIFNIEFRENFFGVDGPPLLDFEVRLHEDTPNFEIIYGALNGNTGDGATVGSQRDIGSHFTQFECSTGGLVDGLQLNFVYASGCPSPTPTPTPTASPISCDNYTTSTTTGNTITPGTTDTGNHCDDCATAIAFPFPVALYGYSFTSANVTANGALDLTGTSDQTSGCLALPDPGWGRAIFPFQGSLFTNNLGWAGCAGYPGGMCGIYTSVTGTAPNRRFNIEWRAVDGNNPANPVNFEVVFYENTTSFFDIFYGATGDNGINATSGVQASGAGPATIFSCGTGTLTSGLKVTYTCPGVSVSQITVDGTKCDKFSSGTATTLGSVTYQVDNHGKTKNVRPPKFMYWVKVTAPAGRNTFVISQSITTGNFNTQFKLDGGGNVFKGSDCRPAGGVNMRQDTTNGTNSAVTVRFDAQHAGVYYIAVKFQTGNVGGDPAPAPGTTVHYDFSTTGVPNSTSSVDLVRQ